MAAGFSTYKAQVKLGPGQSLGFQKGRGYYARNNGSAAGGGGGGGGGLQTMNPAQIANAIAGYTSGLPAPQSPADIQKTAASEISPLIANLTGSIASQTKAGADAISGYSRSLAQQLANELGTVQSNYGAAEQQLAATNAAEAEGIKGTGNDLASSLSAKLAQMGAPGAAQAATLDPVTVGATGAANAAYGKGNASLDQLIQDAAAQEAYTAKLPGIAGSQGMRDINNLQLSANKNLADQTSALEAKVPDLINALTSRSDSAATNRATMAAELGKYYGSRNDALLAGQSKNDTAVKVAQTKAVASETAAQTKAATARETAAAKAAQTSFDNRIKFAKTYGYDPVTNEPLPGYTRDATGHVIKTAKAAGAAKTKTLTPDAITRLVKQWHTGTVKTTQEKQPNADANNNPVYRTVKTTVGQVKYGQAYKFLRLYGVGDKQARAALNTAYTRGDNGRAWLTNEEQAALKKAGVQAYAPNGVLGPKQIAALRNAGMLPPGKRANSGHYVIGA